MAGIKKEITESAFPVFRHGPPEYGGPEKGHIRLADKVLVEADMGGILAPHFSRQSFQLKMFHLKVIEARR